MEDKIKTEEEHVKSADLLTVLSPCSRSAGSIKLRVLRAFSSTGNMTWTHSVECRCTMSWMLLKSRAGSTSSRRLLSWRFSRPLMNSCTNNTISIQFHWGRLFRKGHFNLMSLSLLKQKHFKWKWLKQLTSVMTLSFLMYVASVWNSSHIASCCWNWRRLRPWKKAENTLINILHHWLWC